jgi:hypothetical protein
MADPAALPSDTPATSEDQRPLVERVKDARDLAETYADPYNGSDQYDVFQQIVDLLKD